VAPGYRVNANPKNILFVGRDKSRQIAAQIKKDQRIQRTKEVIERAKSGYAHAVRDPLFLIWLALYWAEGDKNMQERVTFTSSDKKMILFMMEWFREVYKVPEKKFRIALQIHTLFTNKNAEVCWSNITNIPINQFYKTYIKKTSLKQRRNKLYNGTCSIVVNSRELFRTIVGWKKVLLDHFVI